MAAAVAGCAAGRYDGLGKKPFPPWLAGPHGLHQVWLASIAAGCGLLLLDTGALTSYLVAFSGVLGERMTLRLRAWVFGQVLRTAPKAVTRYPLGELTSRIGPDVRQVSDTVGTVFETLVSGLLLLAGMTAVTALLDWRLTLVVLGVLPLYVLTARLRNGHCVVRKDTPGLGLAAVLESPDEAAAGRRHRPRPSRPGRGVAVRPEQVRYGHRPGQLVLERASADLRPGGTIALTGVSGAGKSTLLALLVRLADPQSGRILIDGKDITKLPLR